MVLFCSVPSSSTTSKALYADGDAVGMDPIYASNGGDISSCIEVGHGIGAAFFGSLLASSAKGDDGSAMFFFERRKQERKRATQTMIACSYL